VTKKKESDGRLKIKIYISFYGENSWTVTLGQMKFGVVKIMYIPTSFNLIIVLFDEYFRYCDGVKFLGYVWINVEPLCVQFCNFFAITRLSKLLYFIFVIYELNQLNW
jgi:hypothetical protein